MFSRLLDSLFEYFEYFVVLSSVANRSNSVKIGKRRSMGDAASHCEKQIPVMFGHLLFILARWGFRVASSSRSRFSVEGSMFNVGCSELSVGCSMFPTNSPIVR